MKTFGQATSVMALDALWPVGRALARVFQRSEAIHWGGLAIDTASWREMLVAGEPDIALIDPLGFRESTAELLRQTRAVAPMSKAVVFVPTVAEPIVQRWYDAGAEACIAKWMDPDLILEVIHRVRRNEFDRMALWEHVSPLMMARAS